MRLTIPRIQAFPSILQRFVRAFGRPRGTSSSTWIRLVDFAQHADAVHLFDEFSCKTHCGRIFQGSLDNGALDERSEVGNVLVMPTFVQKRWRDLGHLEFILWHLDVALKPFCQTFEVGECVFGRSSAGFSMNLLFQSFF